jgi:hypothetical protein
MPISPPVRRVILVVLDGLRPDALDAFALDHLRRLTALGAFTPHAQTVAPPSRLQPWPPCSPACRRSITG